MPFSDSERREIVMHLAELEGSFPAGTPNANLVGMAIALICELAGEPIPPLAHAEARGFFKRWWANLRRTSPL